MRTTILDLDLETWTAATSTAISHMSYELSSAAMITATRTLVGVTRPTNCLYSWAVDDEGLYDPRRRVMWNVGDSTDCERVKLTVATDGGRLLVYVRKIHELQQQVQVWWADPATLLPTTRLNTASIAQHNYSFWRIACKCDLAVVAHDNSDSVYLFHGADILRKVQLHGRPEYIGRHMHILNDLLVIGGTFSGLTAWRLTDQSPAPLWEVAADFGGFALLPDSRRFVTINSTNKGYDAVVHEVTAAGGHQCLWNLPLTGMTEPVLVCGISDDSVIIGEMIPNKCHFNIDDHDSDRWTAFLVSFD
jgi:hypothetical protein